MGTFRTARVPDYVAWLRAWLEQGGKPTHYYDYPMSRATWLVALRDFTTGGECGANAAHIIVPAGATHLGGGLGHNGLHLMEGPDLRGHVVPVYGDSEFASLPGISDFIIEKRNGDREREREMAERRAAAREAAKNSDIGRHFSR